MYLLDSNAVIAMLRGHDGVIGRMKERRPDDFAISSIVAHELYYGAFKGTRAHANVPRVDAIPFRTIEFDREDARCAGELRAKLTLAGNQIGPYDVLIAGQAISRSLVLITHNTRAFARIPGLRFEDWEV
jgi:tRNA(fMet)-specific endonuclease VapC